MEQKTLTIGLPSGSLMEPTIALFAKAGYAISGSSRSYRPSVDDPELRIRLLRAQEISRYIEHGYLDCGITGYDWVQENESHLEEVVKLPYSKATSNPTRWVLVVPEDSPVKSVHDLEGKRVATEAVGITRRFFERAGVKVEVEFSWGATEVKVPDLVDAIVDITETGSSLRANKLRIVDTLMESYPALYANTSAWADEWKQSKIKNLALLLKAALAARDLVGLKMNLPEKSLKKLLEALPALRNPTVSPLAQPEWVAIETVIEEKVVREIIPSLKTLGAEGIIEYPLNKVVH
ncbi:ATP phosphoribosyltransferase [bacterium]|jgi:ATP phosphoribosyltransferase|nr:ATP phosphoribosyltransferase [bacterium]NBS52479.1 ATP phosphoribosyltransferase [Spartobacteria bacterium]